MNNKEEVLQRLNAIIREITCMNNGDFEKHLKNDKFEIDFCNYYRYGKKKINVRISMQKVDLE